MAASQDPGLALAFAGGRGNAAFRFDLLAWILDASVEAGALPCGSSVRPAASASLPGPSRRKNRAACVASRA